MTAPGRVATPPTHADPPSALDQARAMLNILDDFAEERDRLANTQRAVLNILDDFASEKLRLESSQRATLNILEDFASEKANLEDMKHAVINILDDLAAEKDRLESTQRDLLQADRALRASLTEKETLLREVHHRVKNNLQVISSLLRLQARYLPDPRLRAVLEESQGRVASIALVHEMLYETGNLTHVQLGGYLRALTSSLADTWRDVAPTAIDVQAEDVYLTVETAIPCGLIVNELVTNALKHAWPDRRPGRITITGRARPSGSPPSPPFPAEGGLNDEGAWIELDVADDGVGLPEGVALRRPGSLGLELVSTLARQLHATVEIRRKPGTTFHFCFQVSP